MENLARNDLERGSLPNAADAVPGVEELPDQKEFEAAWDNFIVVMGKEFKTGRPAKLASMIFDIQDRFQNQLVTVTDAMWLKISVEMRPYVTIVFLTSVLHQFMPK